MDQMNESEQCSNSFQLSWISPFVNFLCELEQIMTRYDFLWARWVILSNIQTNLNFRWIGANNEQIWLYCLYGVDEWFWAMFELTPTWPNVTVGQICMWIWENNDQIWLSMDQMSDSGQCSNRLKLGLISLFVNFSCELGQIMTRYDLVGARRVITEQCSNRLQLDLILIIIDLTVNLVHLLWHVKWKFIWITYACIQCQNELVGCLILPYDFKCLLYHRMKCSVILWF